MPEQPPAERATDYAVTTDGVVIPVIVPRTPPPREEPRRVREPIKVGNWVASLPGRKHDIRAARVDRVVTCAGLDNDRVLMVFPAGSGMPCTVRESEVYRVDPPG
ncbi:hypothetical protein [Embleya sp. NPDC005971]|uniref:hypothetical protein n=1 Tax=unclassified Embleya TaxID=2699296 RepID=UPI0033E832C7